MGASYLADGTQFSKGDYADANNPQDDLAVMTNPSKIMTSKFGYLAYRADDPSITTPKDLDGKTYAGFGTPSEE